ncbi:MAG: hypothetical protein IT438_11765 [Phycisphaerales bacterium]|nr:hypothetical protein [Phycisphaerales bacterium]
MAIDPMLYKKYNKRKTDLDIGATLAQGSARQAERDAMPKGAAAGFKSSWVAGRFGFGTQILNWFLTFGKRNPKR